MTQAIDGGPCELTFGYALPSGESLTLTAHAVYLPRPRIEIVGPQGVQTTFDWQAARDPVLGRVNQAQTFEGWQVWDLAQRLGGQLRAIPGAVLGWDMSSALAMGDALGVPPLAMAELLPVIEAEMVRKLNQQIASGGDNPFIR